MTDLVESSTWTPGIRQFETSDPVEGGPDGIDNVPLRQLANRTRFLKDRQEAHEGAVDPYPQYATKADLAQKVAALVDQSPEALNTLRELANALGNDPSFATTMTNALAQKAPIESPVFTGVPKGTTAGQFDSSTQLATMAAVQRALGSFQMSASLPVGTTNGSVADIGKYFTQQAAAAATYTLPSTAGLPSGSAIAFKVTSNFPLTIQCNGSDVISANGQTVSSLTLGTGDDVVLVCPQKGFWFASGSAVVGQSSKFAASLNGFGYQKLPSGLTLQWGSATSSPNGFLTINFPIAFQNGPLQIATGLQNSLSTAPVSALYNNGSASKSSFNLAVVAPSGSYMAYAVSWIAFGW
ncbi:gp53-like domain-containing protein [Burkholderia ubonensis]|uniref:Putative tail fiber protein gp53-like C-terminal domain-containing protein n=1 Tax=Burkholderia ubonensis TaxID=101571 RepID=A0A1R1J3I7_9BURK|nr:hypothetical protein [Burkholderia ubonensis]OMG69728.1 hypothetical protein BW685_29825 [Burkholderia ubonensis]